MSGRSPKATVLVGAGRYADPWHPLAENGAIVAAVLAEAGFETHVGSDADELLAHADEADLIVALLADPWRNGETGFGASERSRAGLRAALASGTGILAMHSSIASLRDYPDWAAALGGVWLPGISFHPEFAEFEVELGSHPLVDGLGTFPVADERYCDLQRIGDSEILAWHTHEGRPHPLIWARKHGASAIVYDALGHDTRSFDHEPHREFLRRAARWVSRSTPRTESA